MENGTYTAHEVAVILADAFGDDCACNFNGNDEWLPYLCELQEACPHPCGVACWEQYLKYRHCKNEMEEKEDESPEALQHEQGRKTRFAGGSFPAGAADQRPVRD